MEKANPSKLKTPKVYFTETDPLLLTPIDSLELSEKLKLLCILNENVVIAASHMLESHTLRDLLFEKGSTNLLPLLQEGVILPALRDECDNIKELVKIKQKNPQPEIFRDRYTIEKGSFLDDNTSKVVKWSAPATSEEFRESVITVINTPNFRQKLAVKREVVDNLIKQLAEAPSFGRSIVDKAVKILPQGKRRNRVKNIVNISYYLSGAHAVQCDPVIHSNDLYGFYDKFQIASSHIPKDEYASFYNETELFKQYLKDFSVDESVLSRLDANTILAIRKESITEKFRQAYSTVISKATKDRLNDESVDKYNEMKDSLLQLIDEVTSQKITQRQKKIRRTSKIIKTASISSFVTSILSLTIPQVAIPAGLIGFGLYFVDPLVNRFYKSRKSEFALFADTIREHSLRAKLQN